MYRHSNNVAFSDEVLRQCLNGVSGCGLRRQFGPFMWLVFADHGTNAALCILGVGGYTFLQVLAGQTFGAVHAQMTDIYRLRGCQFVSLPTLADALFGWASRCYTEFRDVCEYVESPRANCARSNAVGEGRHSLAGSMRAVITSTDTAFAGQTRWHFVAMQRARASEWPR